MYLSKKTFIMVNNMRSFITVIGNEEVVKMINQRIDCTEELSKDKEFDNGNDVRSFVQYL
jgi:hypothetical protein